MRTLYESLLTGKVNKPRAKERPRSKSELKQIIDAYVEEIKPHPGQEVDLNWIDISKVNDLSHLFELTDYIPIIDKWEIDHVKDFSFMFARNKYIVRSPIPVLQEVLPTKECYERMFKDCTSFKEPPVLPAMKLKPYCYAGMFEGCASLTEPPELPAENLELGCYVAMFGECSSLKQAPQLPAENLAYGCYSSMFRNCTSLEEPPVLPAMKLVQHCYERMFKNCTSLEEPPELPAKELAASCYEEMFRGCSSLKTKAKVPAGVHLDGMITAQYMYKGCYNIE